MKHLQRLAAAGGSHVHLLPAFDLATINEDRSQHQTTPDLSGFPARFRPAAGGGGGDSGSRWLQLGV
jgi:hypothetical protein